MSEPSAKELRYITARELLLAIQESQPKLDFLQLNSMNENVLKFIRNSGFILVPASTVQKIVEDPYLKTVFYPVPQENWSKNGYIGTFVTESMIMADTRRKKPVTIDVPVYAPAMCDMEFNSSHDYNVFLTPDRFSSVYGENHPFAAIIK